MRITFTSCSSLASASAPITGISRFAHANLFSTLNNLKDISWDSEYADLCGFRDADLQGALLPYLEAGAENLDKPVKQVMQELRDHYSGYCFGHPNLSESVYNPFSLLNCLQDMQAATAGARWQWLGWPNYWAASGTPQFLVRMAREGNFGLASEPPPVDQLMHATYDLTNIDSSSLMLQTGYLTLRMDQGRLCYDYPNNEVRLTFSSSLLQSFGRYANTDELTGLYSALADEDYAAFCTRLHTFMAGMPGEKIANETDCHLILHALCQLMRVEFQSEVHQLGGRSDLEVVFPGHVCVFEFKYNQSPAIALEQIEATRLRTALLRLGPAGRGRRPEFRGRWSGGAAPHRTPGPGSRVLPCRMPDRHPAQNHNGGRGSPKPGPVRNAVKSPGRRPPAEAPRPSGTSRSGPAATP